MRPRTIAGEPGHLSDHQLQFCFQVQHAAFVRNDQRPVKLRQRFDRHVQLSIGQDQQVFDSRNKLQGRRRCLPSIRPAIVAQHAGQGLVCQFRTALLQPKLAADLQQNAAVDRVWDAPLLHQPLRVAQPDECLGVIALVRSQLGLTEKAIQHAFVVVAQAIVQARLKELGSSLVCAQTQGQPPTTQCNSSQQGGRSVRTLTEQLIDVAEQTFGASRGTTLLQPLRMIEFHQALEHQRTFRPRQAQRLAVEGLRHIEFTP
ncbi:hypothetical protein D3C84_793540 [compost metagenome]